HFRLLDDLFHSQLADDAAQVAFHHQADQPFAFLRLLGEELFRRGQDRFRIGLHLDLRHRFHRYGHTLPRIEVLLRRHVKRHQLQRQTARGLHHRKNKGATALYHARAAQAVDDDGFVRTGFAEHLGKRRQNEQYDQNPQKNEDHYWVLHNLLQLTLQLRFTGQVFPAPDVGNALLVARNDHFRALGDGCAILAARAGNVARALLQKNQFARSAFANPYAQFPEHADHFVIRWIERRFVRHQHL